MTVVEFRSRRPEDGAVEVIGRVSVGQAGGPAVAVGVDAASQAYLDRLLADGVHGHAGLILYPRDGDAFVAALPDAYRGSRLWATRVPKASLR